MDIVEDFNLESLINARKLRTHCKNWDNSEIIDEIVALYDKYYLPKIEQLEKEVEVAQRVIGYDLYSNRKERGAPLWSDKHPYTIDCPANEYNLHEDILCLKEYLVEEKKENKLMSEVVEAARKMMNFDLQQYKLHKAAGDYEHRHKPTLVLLEALSKLEDES